MVDVCVPARTWESGTRPARVEGALIEDSPGGRGTGWSEPLKSLSASFVHCGGSIGGRDVTRSRKHNGL